MTSFALTTPRDMLEKARREHRRLVEHFNSDNVFNYFVTAYHIKDYIQKSNAVADAEINAFLQDQDIKDCQDLCDQGKHKILTFRANPTTHVWTSGYCGAPYGALSYCGRDKLILISGDREVDVECLAGRVLTKWEDFFSVQGL